MKPVQYDLSLLSELTGIKLRKLRYCIDHELAPEKNWFLLDDEVGRPRTFGFVTAVFLVCAVHLLEAGCKRETVKSILNFAARISKPRAGRHPIKTIVEAVIADGLAGRFHVGDSAYARWEFGADDTGWLPMNRKGGPIAGLEPKVVISLDFGAIRDQVLGK
jgi:hypothetical protein